jgi:hypothetical protein
VSRVRQKYEGYACGERKATGFEFHESPRSSTKSKVSKPHDRSAGCDVAVLRDGTMRAKVSAPRGGRLGALTHLLAIRACAPGKD